MEKQKWRMSIGLRLAWDFHDLHKQRLGRILPALEVISIAVNGSVGLQVTCPDQRYPDSNLRSVVTLRDAVFVIHSILVVVVCYLFIILEVIVMINSSKH